MTEEEKPGAAGDAEKPGGADDAGRAAADPQPSDVTAAASAPGNEPESTRGPISSPAQTGVTQRAPAPVQSEGNVEWERRHSHIGLWINGVIGAFAIAGFVLMAWQVWDAQKSAAQAAQDIATALTQAKRAADAAEQTAKAAEATSRATVESVALAKRQADLGERSLRTTERSMRDRERAWVIIEGLPPQPSSWKLGEEATLTIAIRNAGTLPAFRVMVTSGTGDLAGVPPKFPLADLAELKWRSLTTIGAGTAISQEATIFKFSTPRVEAITSGRLNVYVFARAVYADQLGQVHKTTFCQFLDPEKRNWRYCDRFNEIN